MLETTSNLSLHDNLSDMSPAHQFSLPLIGKTKPALLNDHSDLFEKDKLTLPPIHHPRDNPEASLEGRQGAGANKKERKQLAREVRAKLDRVLGDMPESFHTAEQGQGYSEDEDFEARINENKAIIKQHRLKKEKQGIESPRNKKKPDNKIKMEPKARMQSLYEKRAKEYREQSIDNKYLQKKKQYVKLKNANYMESGKESKAREVREEYNSVKNSKKDQGKDRKKYPRAVSHKPVQKSIDTNKSSNMLFDGIQNILQNPQEAQKKEMKGMQIGLTLLKAKRDIEDKIKIINEKLGVRQDQESIRNILIKSVDMEPGFKEWRKVQINSQKIETQPSNFDKELERINFLQERTSVCLEKYLEHQKILVELQLRQRELERKTHANSH